MKVVKSNELRARGWLLAIVLCPGKARPRLVRGLALQIVVAISLSVPALAQEAPAKDSVELAVDKAVAYLVKQQKDSGAIHSSRNHSTMTALSIMAMSAAGHQVDDPTPEGAALRKAMDYMLSDDRHDKNGYFNRDGGRMYGHGITCLMLAELLGMGLDAKQDALIRTKLKRGLAVILHAQKRKHRGNRKHFGGWRYEPHSDDSDLSVTIWQLLTLRAARNAGMNVPKESIDYAILYLRACYKSNRGKDGKPTNLKSACAYQPGNNPSYASGAAGLLAMQACGQYGAPEVEGSSNWLHERKLKFSDKFFFYGTYYYAQGMYQRGGRSATKAREQVERILLKTQRPDGSWHAAQGQEKGVGGVYATSMAILSLSVRYHYLPIYQR